MNRSLSALRSRDCKVLDTGVPPLRLPEGARVGCVEYLNSIPLMEGISDQVTLDVPSVLADNLRQGGLDAALVPVFEWFSNPVYQAVDGVSISCNGSVLSVILVSSGPLEDLHTVWLDPASRTSAQLVQIILKLRYALTPKYETARSSVELMPGEGRLLIGDPALRVSAAKATQWTIVDLGAEWKKLTNLPFVFALWLIRPGYAAAADLAKVLRNAATLGSNRIADYAGRAIGGFEPELIREYLSNHVRHRCGQAEKAGLLRFGQELHRMGILKNVPGLPEWI